MTLTIPFKAMTFAPNSLGEIMALLSNPEEIISSRNEAITSNEPEEFFPKGAIAFFVCLMAGFALIWAGIYLLMVHRQFHL